MKTTVLTTGLILALAGTVAAMDRWAALSQVESGDNDRAVGSAGEISRYQIKPAIWRKVIMDHSPYDPRVALTVAQTVMLEQSDVFQKRYHRPPTDFEFYVLWNAPGQLIGPQERPAVTKVVQRRAQRFSNLVAGA